MRKLNNDSVFLSVVIIARNEEENIARCIQSVLDAAKSVDSKEIIFVDSVSSDRTVEIAKTFPIKILQFREHEMVSPSAGRYIGTKNSNGNYVLYLDGDMVVNENWLNKAIDILEKNEKFAGVCGWINDLYTENGNIIKVVKDRMNLGDQEGIASTFGGAGLYRKSIIDEVGGFNPFIRNMEEAELAIRIRRYNYILWKIPVDMVEHYTHNRDSVIEFKNAVQISKKPGIGQVFRIAYENGFFWQLAFEHFYAFHLLVFIFFIIAYILGGLYFDLLLLEGLLVILLALYLLLAIKKKSFKAAAVSLSCKIFPTISLIREFFRKPKTSDEYQANYVEIK